MLRYKYIFILFVLASFSGCKKWRYGTKVEGTVADATTFSPIAGAKVYLQKTNDNCYTCGSITVQSTTVDPSGNFSFDFTADKNCSYNVAAEANNYFNDFGSGGVNIETGNKKNHPQILLQPKAWIKVHIKNLSPFNGNDQLGLNCGTCGSPIQFYGMSVDTLWIILANGNENNTINWGVVKNNITNNYSAQIYCPSFATTLFNINY